MEEYNNKFIGPNKIKSIEPSERKTYSGKEMYQVTYRNNKVEYYSEAVLEDIVTGKSRDLTALRDLRCFPVVKSLLEVLAEANVKLGEIDYILERTGFSLQENIKKAADILWEKEFENREMMDVEEVLESAKQDEK